MLSEHRRSSLGQRCQQFSDVGQWCGVEDIVPLAAVIRRPNEAGIAQDTQVPTDRRTRDRVLRSEVDDARGPCRKLHEQGPANGISEAIEHVHAQNGNTVVTIFERFESGTGTIVSLLHQIARLRVGRSGRPPHDLVSVLVGRKKKCRNPSRKPCHEWPGERRPDRCHPRRSALLGRSRPSCRGARGGALDRPHPILTPPAAPPCPSSSFGRHKRTYV